MFIRRLLITISLLLALGAINPLVAEQPGADPAINRPYQDPDYQRWLNIFERPGREVYDQRHEIVAALELRDGMAVADIGAGTGLFSMLFAEVVGQQGKVYTVDISQNFIDNILRRAKAEGLDNVQGIVNDQHSTRLPAASVDVVFISDTYHHFEYPADMLGSIYQALRPGGRLAIIDFRKQPGQSSGWVMSHVRANREMVIEEVTSAGFRLEREPAILQDNYFLIFRKP